MKTRDAADACFVRQPVQALQKKHDLGVLNERRTIEMVEMCVISKSAADSASMIR